ncbi:MAG: rhodanese-like domain-containing protein [Gemmatimonadota bacterium]|nr:rhodanese-like domain-containing protein [Gemmatimonadota bacterium]
MKTLKTIETDHVREFLENDACPIINVLDEEDFERAHIPGTRNIPLASGDLVERVDDLVDHRSDTVVVYCAGPECDASPKAAELLREAGFTDVFDYEGGMAEWISAGNPVERAEPVSVH